MGWRFLYYASDKRHWQCLTSSHLLLLHLPLWEHSGNQKGDKGPTEIDKKPSPAPGMFRNTELLKQVLLQLHAGVRLCLLTCHLPGHALHCILMEDNIQAPGQAMVKEGVF